MENFDDRHRGEQIGKPQSMLPGSDSLELLQRCRADEVAHRDDERKRVDALGLVGRCWAFLVSGGLRLGVKLARHV